VIERLTSDSRRAAKGTAFFAWPGAAADGRRHIADAVKRGASAVLWESEGFAFTSETPNVGVKNLKEKAGFLAHQFHGRPSESLWMCGVTGTNGKTTCSQWVAAALDEKSAVVGTLGAGFPGGLNPVANTTPDALETHALLKDFRDQGATAVAMEVSSHGLDQGRVNGVAFDCALFTNLTHDHLDYHRTMAAYGEAKAKLFDAPGLETAVINLDDPFGRELAKRTRARVLGFGFSGDAFLVGKRTGQNTITVRTNSESIDIAFPHVGAFNLSNALGVLGCLMARGIPFADAARRLERLPPVPGRMQAVGDRPLVVVDYAHTPDALEKVLAALQPVARSRGGKLAVVIGAGGDRDPAKRPAMGAVASRLADRVLLTSDNPRGEDPLAIIDAIRQGTTGKVAADPDRESAIRAAIAEADGADVILVAGKGHETSQEIAGRRTPFSDMAVAAAALGLRRER
jgi:UDP-N-acetylmuramoyl-L-alanyl-D-glutamate--2,6-diaminopimelate ligase